MIGNQLGGMMAIQSAIRHGTAGTSRYYSLRKMGPKKNPL
jgi:hypothetical protein